MERFSSSEEDSSAGSRETWKNLLKASILFALYAAVLVTNLGIIVYENVVPDTYRTLINKMVAVTSLYNICLSSVITVVFAVPLLPLGEGLAPPVCGAVNVSLGSFATQLFLAHNEVMLLRYVYACRLSTVGSVDEGLVRTFLVGANAVLGTLFASAGSVAAFATGSEQLPYLVCVGSPGGAS